MVWPLCRSTKSPRGLPPSWGRIRRPPSTFPNRSCRASPSAGMESTARRQMTAGQYHIYDAGGFLEEPAERGAEIIRPDEDCESSLPKCEPEKACGKQPSNNPDEARNAMLLDPNFFHGSTSLLLLR